MCNRTGARAETFNKVSFQNLLRVRYYLKTLPRGWERTYPNLLTMEAVRGAENYDYDKDYPEKAVWHNTIYPFTRNVVGSSDYTPVTFSHLTYPHLTSNAHELALSIVYESGILHFADKVDSYASLDPQIRFLLKNLPVTWDETKFIAGEPGKYVVLARRKGDKWFVGGINGQEIEQEVMLDIKQLRTAKLVTDGDGAMNLKVAEIDNNSDSVKIVMIKSGGFVAF